MRKVGLLFGFCFSISSLFAQEPRLVLPIGHTFDVNSARFSPDGRKIVTASLDNTVKIWDAETGAIIIELKGNTFAQFSSDGKKILTIAIDHTAKIWDAKTGAQIADLKGAYLAQFSPDSREIVTAANDSTSKIWDAETGRLLKDLKDHNDDVHSAQFSPDNKKLVITANDNTAELWDTETGKLTANLNGHTEDVVSAQFSSDNKKIVTASWDNTAKIWDAETGKLLKDLRGHTEELRYAEFSPDNKKIITASYDRTAKIWDVETGKLLENLKGHTGYVISARFSPDGKKIATASNDRTAKIWDVETGKLLENLKGHNDDIHSAQFSPTGKKLVTASSDYTAKVWNVETGQLLLNLKGHTYWVYSALFSPDGKKIATAIGDSTAKIWDSETGRLLIHLKDQAEDIRCAQFSNDSKRVVTASYDKTAKVWRVETGELLVDLKGDTDIRSARFSPDGKKIATASDTVKIWDSRTGRRLRGFKSYIAGGNSVQFSPDGNKIATASNRAKIWSAETGELLTDLEGHNSAVNSAIFSPDGKRIVTASDDSTAKIWNAETGNLLTTLTGHNDNVRLAQFSPNGKKVVTASWDNTAKIWDAETGRLLVDLKGHINWVNSAQFSPDSKTILTGSADNTCKIWNAESGKLINTFFAVDSADYFNQIPSGYYMCTQNAAKLLHYVTKDLEVITFDQLDIKYNRPDKVLEAIGCPDTALIHAYHRAYEKRIKKLGIDTTSFKSGYSVPKSDFLNRDQIEQQPEQKRDELSLHITGSDSTYNLDRFNVWVNQVPVYGVRGISLKNRHKSALDTTVTIKLSQGNNRIETSVTDANGTESYHIPLYVKYTPGKPVDTMLYFVGIGIDKFADKNYNLQWSVKDIQDLAKNFKEKYKKKCRVYTLYNESVCKDSVIALKKKLLQSGVNDKVVIAYSGHGLLSKDHDYFLSTYYVDFKDPAKNGLPYDALENLLDSIPARKKLMLIDACHSGELDKDEMNRYTQTAIDRQKNGVKDEGHKGAEIELTQKSGMSMASSFELMKQLFVNVGKSTGATIISAAGGVQYALEKNDLKNGVFTYSILENMQKNPHTSISALKQYVNKRVTELTAGMQVPTTRNETDVVDWEVW